MLVQNGSTVTMMAPKGKKSPAPRSGARKTVRHVPTKQSALVAKLRTIASLNQDSFEAFWNFQRAASGRNVVTSRCMRVLPDLRRSVQIWTSSHSA
jgi:hypothetical protein